MRPTPRFQTLSMHLAALAPHAGMTLDLEIHDSLLIASIRHKGMAFIRIGRNGPTIAAPDDDAQIAAASALTPPLIQACRDWEDAAPGPVSRLLVTSWRLVRRRAPTRDLDDAVRRIAARAAAALPSEGMRSVTLLADAAPSRSEWTYAVEGAAPSSGDAAPFVPEPAAAALRGWASCAQRIDLRASVALDSAHARMTLLGYGHPGP